MDWGEVRIGLALSDETQMLASPLETLIAPPGKRFPMPGFLELVAEHAPVGLVVGLPLTARGRRRRRAPSRPGSWPARWRGGPGCRWSCGTSG